MLQFIPVQSARLSSALYHANILHLIKYCVSNSLFLWDKNMNSIQYAKFISIDKKCNYYELTPSSLFFQENHLVLLITNIYTELKQLTTQMRVAWIIKVVRSVKSGVRCSAQRLAMSQLKAGLWLAYLKTEKA